jgi:transposase-like protein
MLTVVPDVAGALPADGQPWSLIDQIVRDGARQMLAAALQAEVAAYIGQAAGVRDEDGRRMVVRNGTAGPRTVLTSAGAVEVTAPRVNDKRAGPAAGERMRFSAAILPPWARKTPQVSGVLPLLCLHGLCSGDFGPTLGQFPGTGAGLSSLVITKLTGRPPRSRPGTCPAWTTCPCGPAGSTRASGQRRTRLCLLVITGVRAGGRKEPAALAGGYRESAGSRPGLLRDCARRGMRAPVLATGDGAPGFWRAAREVFPQARTQRCWFHKIANVLGAPPKSAHPGAKKAPAEIWNAQDKDHARTAVRAFAAAYGAKFPKAAAKITEDEEELPAFYHYPAEHRVHLRTTSPIESTFATVRLRTKVTKGHGSRAAGLAMAFQLIESAQCRWRMVNAPRLVALARAGATFINGKLIERPGDEAAGEAPPQAA